MIKDIWLFLQDQNNQTELAWIGGGVAVVVGGLWTVWKFFHLKNRGVSATGGGVAAGRDISNSAIDTRGHEKP